MAGVVIITVKTDSPENRVLRGLLRQLLLFLLLSKGGNGDPGRSREGQKRKTQAPPIKELR